MLEMNPVTQALIISMAAGGFVFIHQFMEMVVILVPTPVRKSESRV